MLQTPIIINSQQNEFLLSLQSYTNTDTGTDTNANMNTGMPAPGNSFPSSLLQLNVISSRSKTKSLFFGTSPGKPLSE